MSMRAVEITETYTPGKKLGNTRTVTIERIPATEVTYGGITDTHVLCDVAERVDVLIGRALRASDAADQRITFTAADGVSLTAAGSEPS